MARPNKAALARQHKDAKQKKLLFVLVPVFLLLVVWQGPKMYGAFFGSQTEAAPPPAPTTPAPAAPGATPPAGAPAAPAAPSAALADTDVPPAPGTHRLVSFSRFESRNPFGRAVGAGGTDAGTTPDAGSEGADETADSAVFEVNGTSETVSLNGDFPAADSTFRLVSISGQSAVIGLVSGSFEGDEETVTLAVGDQVELVADPDGTRYSVTLVSVG